jgi:hypothetical protein
VLGNTFQERLLGKKSEDVPANPDQCDEMVDQPVKLGGFGGPQAGPEQLEVAAFFVLHAPEERAVPAA